MPPQCHNKFSMPHGEKGGGEQGIPPAQPVEPTGAAGEIHRRNFSDLLSSHLLHRRERERERERELHYFFVGTACTTSSLPSSEEDLSSPHLLTCLTLYRSYHRCIASSLFRHSLNGGSDARFPKFFTAAGVTGAAGCPISLSVAVSGGRAGGRRVFFEF